MKVHDEDWAIGKAFSSIDKHETESGVYWKGLYNFHDGTVIIYQEDKLVSLSFYANGRGYYRTIHGKTYTDIGLARVAGRFARHVLSNLSKI